MLALIPLVACVTIDADPLPTGDTAGDDDTTGPAVRSGDLVCPLPDDQALAAIEPEWLPRGTTECREPALVYVGSVTDGDTIDVRYDDGSWESVRIIGVDTPETWGETECYGPEAKQFATAALEERHVWLTHDAGCRDGYDRLLAYVHLSNDIDCFFERLLLRGGYAETMTFSSTSSYAERFAEDEDWARDNDQGMWADCR